MASNRPVVFASDQRGGIFSLGLVNGLRVSSTGVIVVTDGQNQPLCFIDPNDVPDVSEDDILRDLRRAVRDFATGRPVQLPDWLRGDL